MKVQLNDIKHPDTYEGKEPRNHSPSFDYCRKLVAEGYDPLEPLEVYRGDKLAYTVKSIGLGAKLKIKENEDIGPIVVKYKPLSEEARAKLRLNRPKKKTPTGQPCV